MPRQSPPLTDTGPKATALPSSTFVPTAPAHLPESLGRLHTELVELAFALEHEGRLDAADVAISVSARIGELLAPPPVVFSTKTIVQNHNPVSPDVPLANGARVAAHTPGGKKVTPER